MTNFRSTFIIMQTTFRHLYDFYSTLAILIKTDMQESNLLLNRTMLIKLRREGY